MKKTLMMIALASAVASPTFAQTPASAPANSAYQGTVGDWALGRWTGYRYLDDANFTRLVTEDRVLIVTKLPDRRVRCQWAVPNELARTGWATRCEITASKITLRTPANADVVLDREGADLEGRYIEAGARNRVHMHRGTAQH